jgi:hypothetical protein
MMGSGERSARGAGVGRGGRGGRGCVWSLLRGEHWRFL